MKRRFSRVLAGGAVLALGLGSIPPGAAAQQEQTYTVRGVVRDAATGSPLAGAQVVVRGTSRGAITDNAGRFALVAPLAPGTYTLEASFIGRASAAREITLAGEAVVDLGAIALEVEVLALEGVVVTGTAAPTSRRAIGNTIAVLETGQVAESPATTVDEALGGKIAGAVVTRNTGTPGGGVSVRLRGTSSIIGGAEPLYIVDGVIVDNNADQQINFGYRSNPSNRLADLDPNDIERVEVIKGAAAAALYGSRANNGVIQIFTKRGRSGASQITAGTRVTRETLPKRLPFALTPVEEDGSATTRYDHQDLIFRDAVSYDNYVALSGGTEDTRYYLSANYTDQQGIMLGSDHEKLNVRVNLDQAIGGKVEVSGGANYVTSASDLSINGEAGQGGLLTAITFTNTNVDLAQRDPESGELTNSAGPFPNPLHVLESWRTPQEVNRFIGSLGVRFAPVTDLTFEYRLGYDNARMETSQFIPRGSSAARLGSATAVLRQSYLVNNDVVGNYSYNAGPSVRLTTSAGLNQSYSNADVVSASARDLTLLTELVRGAVQFASQSRVETTTLGFFGQQQAALNNRLFLTGALRWDASSTFGRSERWQVYPKLAGSWVLSEEPFWGASALGAWLPELRLRAALGYAGNQPPTDRAYARIPRYAEVTSVDRLGLVHLADAGNPNLKPERQREFETGLDASLLGGRLGLSLTYYDQYTKDLLLTRPFANSTGYGSILDNVGEMSNKGLELQLTSLNLQREGLRWSSTFILSRNVNKVEKLEIPDFTDPGSYNNRVAEGEPLGVFYDFGLLRDENGNVVYRDGNPNFPLRDTVRSILGNPWPDFAASLRNDLRLGQNLTASVLLDGAFGHEVWNQTRRIMDRFRAGPLYDRQLRGEITDAERLQISLPVSPYIEDASYIKLRELSLRYAATGAWVQRMGVRSIEFELVGRNLKTWTDYTGYDPEVNMFGTATVARGVDFAVYPHARSFGFGVRVNY